MVRYITLSSMLSVWFYSIALFSSLVFSLLMWFCSHWNRTINHLVCFSKDQDSIGIRKSRRLILIFLDLWPRRHLKLGNTLCKMLPDSMIDFVVLKSSLSRAVNLSNTLNLSEIYFLNVTIGDKNVLFGKCIDKFIYCL